MAGSMTRRDFVHLLGTASAGLLAAACGAPSTAQPTEAPAKPTAAPQAAPQTAPATGSGAAAPGASKTDDFKVQWEALINAAKKEGKVVVQNPAGTGYRKALDEFQSAFPGIEVEQQQFADSATYIPKIKGERAANIFSLDVVASTVVPLLQVLKPEGIIDPLRPQIFHPEALDEKAWYGGFEGRWADLTKTHVIKHNLRTTRPIYINTKFVKEGEITKVEDLLNPKWKGQIVTSDLVQGYIYSPSTVLRETKGEDFLRQLFVGTDAQIIRDRRQAIEQLIRGGAAIGFGLHPIVMQDFVKDGLAGDIKNLDMPDANYSGGEVVGLYNKAPHPNAAKLFINWILSKDGQIAWSRSIGDNSARKDVPIVDQNDIPKDPLPVDPTQEEWMPRVAATQAFLLTLK
jgi:iron(III) transport system substrate-binding protein